MQRIFHVSETPSIPRFAPRVATDGVARVWAVNAARLHNYLLPRDCPRVTYFAAPTTTEADRARFFSSDAAESVVAIERGWLARVRATRLYVYELPHAAFAPYDEIAGYFTSEETVLPIACTPIDDVLAELLTHPIELRVLASLWRLRDAVVASSLAFSIIRMRNATPRVDPEPQARYPVASS
jgi:hypothetical protein